MKASNICFTSNIYKLDAGQSKIADKNFMAHVIDPNALQAIVKLGNGSTRALSPLQIDIYKNSIPCANVKDYSYGTIKENGEYVCVNKCEVFGCNHFSECSAMPNYRPVSRDIAVTPEAEISEERDSWTRFEIELPGTGAPVNSKVKKVSLGKIKKQLVTTEISTIIRNYTDKIVGVRAHLRHYADGTTTWVRSYNRHNSGGQVDVVTQCASVKPIIFRLKDNAQLKRINKKILDIKRKKQIEKTPYAYLGQTSSVYQLKNTTPLNDATCIIESGLDSRILVNAGPGTGKTHTVIERLKHIANMDDIDPDSILVLCFSRSAVKVIRNRLSAAVDSGHIPYDATRFTVSTFDSFATWYIKQIDEDFDLSDYGYDDRIKLFVEKYTSDINVLNNALRYLIIDEVQDLVGIRALLVKCLLENINCGFLLLGDECQAIYDYQITNPSDWNAAKLYEWLEAHFGNELNEYELLRNWRNPGKIGDTMNSLRNAMLYRHFPEQRKALRDVFEKHEISDMSVEDMIQCCNDGSGETRAILSWSNGDAYRQSRELYTRTDIDVKHELLTGSGRIIYRREIADILSCYVDAYITYSEFVRRGSFVGLELSLIEKLWQGMMFAVDKSVDDDLIDLAELRRALVAERRISEDLTEQDDFDVTISTIHKAKGKEYDMVILNQFGNIKSCDDIKVYYVAMTRAKKEVVVQRKERGRVIDFKTRTGRYVELGSDGRAKKIKKVELGLDGDIDYMGFVDKDLPGFGSVEERQKYIAQQIKIGDRIQINKRDGEYLISHNGHFIGRIHAKAFNPFNYRAYWGAKNYICRFDSFTDYEDLYVKNIVTIINTKLNSSIADPYRKNGIWYGIEFSGYARPREE